MSTVIELLGLAALVAAGVLVYLPLGLLVGGACLLYVAWSLDGVRVPRPPRPHLPDRLRRKDSR